MPEHHGKHWDESSGQWTWKTGSTIAEIAAVMHLPEAAVKTILYRALAKLRENIGCSVSSSQDTLRYGHDNQSG